MKAMTYLNAPDDQRSCIDVDLVSGRVLDDRAAILDPRHLRGGEACHLTQQVGSVALHQGQGLRTRLDGWGNWSRPRGR